VEEKNKINTIINNNDKILEENTTIEKVEVAINNGETCSTKDTENINNTTNNNANNTNSSLINYNSIVDIDDEIDKKISDLIKSYVKVDREKTLHDLRVLCRRKLSILEKYGYVDVGLKGILKNSSKLRDTDVLMKICKSKKIKKYLKEKHKKLRKKFIKYLKTEFKRKIVPITKKDKQEFIDCKRVLSTSFTDKDDKTLHKIRILIKKCRYTNPQLEKELKKIQDYLGLAHDYYNCERLRLKFNLDTKKTISKKKKYIKLAEKERKKLLKKIHNEGIL